jgi:hypothetical protein
MPQRSGELHLMTANCYLGFPALPTAPSSLAHENLNGVAGLLAVPEMQLRAISQQTLFGY